MCGIAGFIGLQDERLLRLMVKSLEHRGPDDEAYFVSDPCCLGMRRLSIIDLTPGIYPLTNEQGDLRFIFNGEIYNFTDLRKELEGKGHKFRTNSDGEVFVHAYEEWKEKALDKLNGMFAIALWDEREKKLLLARDRLGVKPLYYFQVGRKLFFSSEIKAFLSCSHLDRKIDPGSLVKYMHLRYVPGEDTIFQNIKKLLPGYFLTFRQGKTNKKQYWDLPLREEIHETEEFFAERVRHLLEDSVEKRLMSDVPLGAFLSGGVDSSCVVFLMSQLMSQPVKTYAVGFEEEDYNELAYARLAAKWFGTDHKELVVTPHPLDLIHKCIWHLDEPLGDAAAISTYLISRLAREEVTVVLTGEGGDELFAGYPRYAILAKKRKLKEGLRKFLGLNLPSSLLRSAHRFDKNRKRLFSTGFVEEASSTDLVKEIEKLNHKVADNDEVQTQSYFDTKFWLPDDILMKVDKMSMAVSLEAREPFLDYRLVEFAQQIPFSEKYKRGIAKYILRKAFQDALPPQIFAREKHGFTIPIEKWLRGELKDLILVLVNDKKTDYFDYSYLRERINKHLSGKENNRQLIWSWLVFELWHEAYIQGAMQRS